MSTIRDLRLGLVLAAAVALGACAGGASTTAPSPPVGDGVNTPQEAVGRVFAAEPRLAGTQPFDTGMIGQSSWYTVEPASGVGAYVVTVTVGWGDCPAGCIDQHTWVYAVSPDGDVRTVNETGPPVPNDAWPGAAGGTGAQGIAVAGPVCPVETKPPDPNCAPRAVAGAVIVARDARGAEVARVTTEADGTFFLDLPAGGYFLEPQPVDGMLGTPAQVEINVGEGAAQQIQLEYDTGIR